MQWPPVRMTCNAIPRCKLRATSRQGSCFPGADAGTRLFLRAEDMFGYTARLSANIDELEAIKQDFAALPEGADGSGLWVWHAVSARR